MDWPNDSLRERVASSSLTNARSRAMRSSYSRTAKGEYNSADHVDQPGTINA